MNAGEEHEDSYQTKKDIVAPMHASKKRHPSLL